MVRLKYSTYHCCLVLSLRHLFWRGWLPTLQKKWRLGKSLYPLQLHQEWWKCSDTFCGWFPHQLWKPSHCWSLHSLEELKKQKSLLNTVEHSTKSTTEAENISWLVVIPVADKSIVEKLMTISASNIPSRTTHTSILSAASSTVYEGSSTKARSAAKKQLNLNPLIYVTTEKVGLIWFSKQWSSQNYWALILTVIVDDENESFILCEADWRIWRGG